ncbi:FixH family protein [Ferrovibrio xuzhouensis]|uniref:FixH family protein n=1 Tax=Ferrovibrio xuzhouensis TaxID=1576914 RepID=A0ABV7VI12_9PROT
MTTFPMKRAAAAALAAVLSVAALSTARADITDYEFRLVQMDVKQGNGAIVAVRLVDKRSGKAVPDAVIFATRIDMAPDGMETMAAPIEALPSTEPGVYRFKTNLMMAGGWRLSLGAKIQGETGTIENKLVLKAVP